MTIDGLSQYSVNSVMRMRSARVFVIGDVLLDAYITGKVSRISPEAPVPVVLQDSERFVLGGAANVAANVAAFGAQVWLCGRVGTDSDAQRIDALCREQGIHTEWLVRSADVPTIRKTRVLAGYQQIVRIDQERCDGLAAEEFEYILCGLQRFLEDPTCAAVLISDYAKGVITPALLREAIGLCNRAGVPVIADPKSLDLSRYAGCTVIKPNLKDGREALRAFRPAFRAASFVEETSAMVDCFLENSGARNVVLSMSEHGVYVRGLDLPNGARLPTRALEVADVSGAGDTMVTYLALGLAAGFSLDVAADFANVAAGVACGKPGTAAVRLPEFLDALHGPLHAGEGKVANLAQAADIVDQHRRIGRRVVFTNGCFDILHAGHVRLLHQARAQGDVLVVGLNSDASVRRLKGATRPVQRQEDRAEILAGLSSVDLVVVFDEDTPIEVIRTVKPDVLVKGGDYSEDTIVGAPEVRSWGGNVHIIPLVEGRSTTSIIARSNNVVSS